MSSANSFQVIDLPALTEDFELNTNNSCRFVTESSQKWLLHLTDSDDTAVLCLRESTALSSMKMGLLAALCFPTCDAPQLRVLTDFLTLLFISNARLFLSANTATPWQNTAPGNGIDILAAHPLFKHIAPQITRTSQTSPVSPTWDTRFTQSVAAFRDAQLQVSNERVPTLEEYIHLRRNICGARILLDLSELLEIYTLPIEHNPAHIETLTQAAIDIFAWSLDICSYQIDQAHGNKYNLIAVLVHHKSLSVQGAVNLAGSMLKDTFASFRTAETALLSPPDPYSALPTPLAWIMDTFIYPSDPASEEKQEEKRDKAQLARCVRNLRNLIVGTINWVYETEIYFGKKGEEVRTFGWVFLNPKP